MEKTMRKIIVFFITLALLAYGALPVFAENTLPGGDIVTTEEELDQWCADHDGTGGTVYLGNDITIKNGVSGGYRGGHVVIDTGEFGLTYDGGVILLSDFEIVGEGVDAPVVTMVDGGRYWMGNWNNDLASNTITALGRNGTGGVALRVVRGGSAAFDTNMVNNTNALIRAYGDGAVGILLDVPLELYCFRAEVDGANSMAVSAPSGTKLYYCRLNAKGTDARAVSGGVTLDTCTASPAPAGNTVIDRRFTDVSGKRFYLPVRQNEGWFWPETSYTFWLSGSDGSEVRRTFMIEWDQDALDAIDTGDLGKYSVQGRMMSAFEGFGLTDNFPLTLTIDVRNPAMPCIGGVHFENFGGNTATLDLWNDYDPAEGGFILWRSDDGGETWYDFTQSPELEWPQRNKSIVIFHYESIDAPIMFCLEASGVESNVVTLYEKDGKPYGDTGGDRTGTDRPGGGNLGETPPLIITPPDGETPSSGETPPPSETPLPGTMPPLGAAPPPHAASPPDETPSSGGTTTVTPAKNDNLSNDENANTVGSGGKTVENDHGNSVGRNTHGGGQGGGEPDDPIYTGDIGVIAQNSEQPDLYDDSPGAMAAADTQSRDVSEVDSYILSVEPLSQAAPLWPLALFGSIALCALGGIIWLKLRAGKTQP